MKTEEIFNGWQKNCPICGKEFYPRPGHAYRIGTDVYCSWTCYRKAFKERRTPLDHRKEQQSQPVEMLTLDGQLIKTFPSAYDAAIEIDCTANWLRECCREEKQCKGYLWRYKK